MGMGRKIFLVATHRGTRSSEHAPMTQWVLMAVVSVLALSATVAAPRVRSAKDIAARTKIIAPAAAGELRLRATFVSCSVCFGAPAPVAGLSLECRSAGGKWKAQPLPPYFPETKDYRGSILGLAEDTGYDVRMVADGKTLVQRSVRTWASEVKVAKTIYLEQADLTNSPFKISVKGTPDGWIRYTTSPGTTLRKQSGLAFAVHDAAYVLLDNLTIEGAPQATCVIHVENSTGVRIRNCDISGWGRTGEPRYDQKSFGKRWDAERRRTINMDGAIQICKGCSEIVVERCYIHDPLGRANSWLYTHPAGPEAVIMYRPDHSTVIRWNDFVGSDNHRFNDAVEGGGNFYEDGGFNRDADIYGNFMIFCNDDNIELDGGQQNVRCFQNRFESAVSGVSIQGCMVSPSYVYDNAFTGMGDEFSIAYNSIKTSGIDLYNNCPAAYVNGNVFWKPGDAINIEQQTVRFTLEGNRLYDGARIFGENPNAKLADNVAEGSAPKEGPIAWPVRPIPFLLDRGMIDGVKVAKGAVAPAAVTVKLSCSGRGYSSPFKVRKNIDMDWFDVTPTEGVIRSGKTIAFTVAFKPEKMAGRRHFRGAFLVRTPDGLSRPVSIYAETDHLPPFKAEKPGEFAQYLDPFKPANASAVRLNVVDEPLAQTGKALALDRKMSDHCLDYEFEVPKDGLYYIHFHGYADDSVPLFGSVDDEETGHTKQVAQKFMSWTPFCPGGSKFKKGARFRFWDLKAGRHVLHVRADSSLRRTYRVDGIVVTDSPGSFEPL